MPAIQAKIENGELVIRIPIKDPPVKSSSGKTLIVASTRGPRKSTATMNDRPVRVSLNAWLVLTEAEKATAKEK